MSDEAERQDTFLITMSGHHCMLRVTKSTIRGLGVPQYLKLLVNETYDEIVVTPCKAKEPMAFKVPDGIDKQHLHMRIVSKSFVYDVLTRNGYDLVHTHKFVGKYLNEQKRAIVFSLKKEVLSEDQE